MCFFLHDQTTPVWSATKSIGAAPRAGADPKRLYGKSYSFLIDINAYKDRRIRLFYAVADARARKMTLIPLEFREKNITLLTDASATTRAIKTELGRIVKKGKAQVRALIYFSDHGTIISKGDSEMGNLLKIVTSKDGAPMVLVPEGKFIMGSNEYDDEKPQRRVYLDGFYIDKYPVTNARFRAAETNSKEDNESKFNVPSQPVVNVTWGQAKAYCEKMDKRLPTEAEWEKAARGVDGGKYPWGNNWDVTKVIWTENSGGKTHPVDRSYNTHESPFGAVDMSGNVWEWVNDKYNKNYYRSAPNRNPKGPESGSGRVFRGGSWDYNDPKYFRAASRFGYDPYSWDFIYSWFFRAANHFWDGPDFRSLNIGFRCAKASG